MDRNRWLEESNDIVADVTNRAADEVGDVRGRDKCETGKDFLQCGQRIARAICAVEQDNRVETDEREASGFFVSLRRFKKKAWLAVVDLGKGRDRRLDIGDKIDNHRDEIAAFRELAELVAAAGDGRFDCCSSG